MPATEYACHRNPQEPLVPLNLVVKSLQYGHKISGRIGGKKTFSKQQPEAAIRSKENSS